MTGHRDSQNENGGSLVVGFEQDPEAPSSWSGIPAGLIAGFRSIGYHVLPLSAQPPSRVRSAVERLGSPIPRFWANDVMARARWPRRPRVAAAVQIGSDFSVPGGIPFATYEDMTVALAERIGYEPVVRLDQWSRTKWMKRVGRQYRRSAACCIGSEWAAQSLVDDYGVPRSKVHVVGFGANHIVKPNPARRSTDPRFLFIGREWTRKNGPVLLRAFRSVREQVPAAELHIVGDHPSIDAQGVVAHGVLRLDSASDRASVSELLQSATCFVMPSQFEPFGIAYVEAGLAGLPSIGTSVGPAREIIGSDGGCIVEPGDEEGLTRAMLHLSDPVVAARMGSAASRRAQSYTWPHVAERVALALGVRPDKSP